MVLGSNFPTESNKLNKETRGQENPPFLYPPKSVRFLEAQRVLDKPSGTASNKSFVLTRGYLKNLQPATVNPMPISKCYFQFNPQEIRQTVSMREDIYNPILLTAEQLTQPIGGNVTFQFDLFFDRSLEVASNEGGQLAGSIGGNFESVFGADTAGPEKVGVYADLRVLYDVIGQGLNESLLELQTQNLKSAYSAKLKRDSAYSSPSANEDGSESTEKEVVTVDASAFDSADVQSVLNANIGNRAFLIPNPVRMVFSKLLMVDGFVTGTNVDFLKFSSNMIPLQCRVAVSVYAMYIGFAKQKTFLTATLDEGRKVAIEESQQATEILKSVEVALNSIKPFRTGFGVYQETSFRPTWDVALHNDVVPNCFLGYYLMPNDAINDLSIATGFKRIAYLGFPSIKPRSGTGADFDPILSLFENPDTSQFSISYELSFVIYGRKDQNDFNGVGWTEQQAKQRLNSVLSNSEIVGKYSLTGSAQDKTGWGSGTSGAGVKRDKIRRRTYEGNEEISNVAPYKLNFSSPQLLTNITNSYYVAEQVLSIRISSGPEELNFKKSSGTYVVKGDAKTGKAINNVNQSTTSFTDYELVQNTNIFS